MMKKIRFLYSLMYIMNCKLITDLEKGLIIYQRERQEKYLQDVEVRY